MFIWIIGADHRIQWIPKSLKPEWSAKIYEFTSYIQAQCETYQIELVAEEFSKYLVEYNNAQNSTVRRAARDKGLPHLFCDPDPEERRALCVESDDDRENEWLRRLKASESERILFICGDDHTSTFAVRLQKAGNSAQVISRNWGQGWEMMN